MVRLCSPDPAMQIIAIQILRAIAAISVSVGHAQAFIGIPMERQGQVFGWNFLLPWGAGVDLFFVISGFIMVYSSERLFSAPGGAKVFGWRRLSRIVPLYWCAMVLLLIKMAVLQSRCRTLPASSHRSSSYPGIDRKSTRLNSSHANISYAVFCLKKKKMIYT